jgi:hypothetical protein
MSSRPRTIERFEREPSGLVDLEGYIPYLIDTPEETPITLPFKNQGPWVRQHVYFQERTYRQKGVPLEEKDMNLVWMRHISYNQVIMRRHMECQLHIDHEPEVAPPPAETIQKCLEDYDHFDLIGAAIVGKVVALQPGAEQFIAPGGGARPKLFSEISDAERASFFYETLEAEIETALSPVIVSERVVTSALKRMAELLGNNRLRQEAQKRIEKDKVYYPLRMPKPAALYHRSNELINQAYGVEAAA